MNPSFIDRLAASPVAPELHAILSTASDDEKSAFLSACIKALHDAGLPLEMAFDAVIGDGAYQKLADDVWTALQPKTT